MFELKTYRTSTLALLFVAALGITSCLSDSGNSVTTYDDVAITSVTLGTANCYRTVKASNGTDSTYKYTYSASTYKMHIDQRNDSIYNVDSLVVGTDLSSILVTIATNNNGTAAWKNIDDSGVTIYSSSDSVDLSQKRTLVVFSSDGQYAREYTVNVAVHKEYADSFTWTNVNADIAEKLASYGNMKAVCAGGVLYVLGKDDATSTLLRSEDGNIWTESTFDELGITLTTGASIAEYNNALWLLNDGTLYTTADGKAWAEVSSPASLKEVVGGCVCYDDGEVVKKELYGITADGVLMVSVDDGITWEADDVEYSAFYDNSVKLPVKDISFVVSAQRTNSDICRATIVANSDYEKTPEDTLAVVWNKTVDGGEKQDWFYTNTAWNNHYYVLPRMSPLTATAYADGIVALGGKPEIGSNEAFSQLYYSPDCGATWHSVDGMRLPDGFAATDAATIVADGKGYIYIISDGTTGSDGVKHGQIWRGRKNMETWAK